MFREIELKSYQIEGVLLDYVLRAKLQPRGHMHAFLNDRNWEFIPFHDAELFPVAHDTKIGGMHKEMLSVSKKSLCLVSLMDQDQVADIQIPVTHRTILIHLALFAVQGELHVTSDAPDEDLMDDLHDFFPISDASIYPICPVSATPSSKVPLLFVSRPMIQAYQVIKKAA